MSGCVYCRQDAWAVLRPRDPGYTYDGRANKMLSNSLRSRLDRVFVKLRDWRLDSIKARPCDCLAFTDGCTPVFEAGQQAQQMQKHEISISVVPRCLPFSHDSLSSSSPRFFAPSSLHLSVNAAADADFRHLC